MALFLRHTQGDHKFPLGCGRCLDLVQMLQIQLQQPMDRRFRFLLQPGLIEQLVAQEGRTRVQCQKRHLVSIADQVCQIADPLPDGVF